MIETLGEVLDRSAVEPPSRPTGSRCGWPKERIAAATR